MGASSSVYVLWWAPEAWLVGSATGLGLPCGPSSLVEGLGRGPFPGRRYPGGHFSLSPAGEESKRVVGTAVGVGALRPKIGPCLHGAQHRPSLTAASPPLPALCPPVPSSCRHRSCQRCVSLPLSLCLLLERSDLSRMWKGPRGPMSWVGKPWRTC